MDKNLKIILDIINSNLKVLNNYGYEIWDKENKEFYINEIKYSAEDDKLYFKCKEDN